MNSNAPESRYCLDQLPDEALLAGTRSLVGRSNQVLAALLAHLAEVEARGIHRVRACASLYTYCIYELRMSEDAAFRRARAAKIAREFPIVFEQLAAWRDPPHGPALARPAPDRIQSCRAAGSGIAWVGPAAKSDVGRCRGVELPGPGAHAGRASEGLD